MTSDGLLKMAEAQGMEKAFDASLVEVENLQQERGGLLDRCWRAEARNIERWGLRKELQTALGIEGDGYGDETFRAALDKIKALKQADALLRDVFWHYEELKGNRKKPDAPGHNHKTPGHWDADGRLCTWCVTWNKVRELFARKDGDK
jgi:hypothetical protein